MKFVRRLRGAGTGRRPVIAAIVGLAMSPPLALAEPLAQSLVGEWTCRPENSAEGFKWIVTDDLPGGWLVGRGYEGGALSSVETWSFNPDGQLMDRRQFTPKGGFIELSVAERDANSLSSEGRISMRDGTVVPVRHRLQAAGAGRFEARWEVREGDRWTVVADEMCTLDIG